MATWSDDSHPSKLNQTWLQALYASLGAYRRSKRWAIPSTASRTHTRQIQGVVTLAAEATSATPSVDEEMIKQLVSHWLNGGGDALSRSVGIEPGHSATFLARLCV